MKLCGECRKTMLPYLMAGFILLITFDLWGVDRRYLNDESPALRNRSNVADAITEYDFDRFIDLMEARNDS